MGEKIIMRPDDKIFYNSKCVFVEYIDLVRSPYFSLLYAFSKNPPELPDDSVFDFSRIIGKEPEELSEFYYERSSQNVLYDLLADTEGVDYDKLDQILDQTLTAELVTSSPLLNVHDAIQYLMWKDSLVAKEVRIWYPYPNPVIENDVKSAFDFSRDIKFISGPIEKALEEIPTDSTYFFSDITKIEVLAELGKLSFASVVTPIEYGYNYSDPKDKSSPLLVNLLEYSKDSTFKFDQCVASIDLSVLDNVANSTPETP